jgi:hypothetical protein
MGTPMSSTTRHKQAQASLAALRESAEATRNSQWLDQIAQLEATFGCST